MSGTSVDNQLLNYVSGYIANQWNNATNFNGSTMLVAQWKNAPPYPHGLIRFIDDRDLIAFINKRNSFQAIIISNGEQTFALFTYHCDMLEWTGLFEHAVIGYNVGEGLDGEFPPFDNYGLSRQPSVNLVACLNEKRGVPWSNLLYKIGDISGDIFQERRARCIAKYEADVEYFGSNVFSDASSARSCPCSIFQALRDRRFAFNFVAQPPSGLSYCFIERFTFVGLQECCYSTQRDSFGSLLTQSDSSGAVGSLLLYHPYFLADEYSDYDLDFKTRCCYESDLCSLYYERRPTDDCASYRPPRFTWGWGDPHITTLDGFVYTFNGWGEYVLVKVDNEFELQGRTVPVNNSNATMFSAFAFGINQAIVEVRTNDTNELEVLLNRASISDDVRNINQSFSDMMVDITRSEDNKIVTSFNNGVSVTVTLSSGILSYVAALPPEFAGQTKGLLGNYNGNNTDDLIYPNETLLDVGAGDRMIHGFGQTWEIEPSQSLFSYPVGLTASDFSYPQHEPVFLDEVIDLASEEILQLCGDNAECIFDAIQTGNTDVALDTLQTDTTNSNDQMITSNHPPTLVGPSVFYVTIGEESLYTFNASDDSGDFNLMVEGGLPPDATIDSSGSSYTLTWTLTSTPDQLSDFNRTIQIIARDDLNATSLLAPQIQICACGEGGNCTTEGVLNISVNPLILNCDCTPAYEGRYCERNVDGCAELSCFEGVECEDIPAPGVGALCGPCPDGYSGDGVKCTDINECANDTLHDCQQVCVNTEGGFNCDCLEGYSLLNSTNCGDVDECANLNGGCHQVCNNTDGGYFCSCFAGYDLQQDNITCQVQATSFCSNTNPCDQNCVLLEGVEICSCNMGYALADNGFSCQDVDECQPDIKVCSQLCNNTDGGFQCYCEPGYELASNERTCLDINECSRAILNGTQLCSNQKICSNTDGSYSCICPVGTIDSGEGCIEICEENYYRLTDLRCTQCPDNSVRSLSDNDSLCECQSGYKRQSDSSAALPCLPVVGFTTPRVSFLEGSDTHDESVQVAISASPSRAIAVTFTIFPDTFVGFVSEQVSFARGSKIENTVITVEGNQVATDGDRAFTVSINSGSGYIVGGVVGDDVYHSTVHVTVEEDDDLLPDFETNSIIVTLGDFTIESFTAEHQFQFKETTADAINRYCRVNTCNFMTKKRQESTITSDNIVLRDIMEVDSRLQITMFVTLPTDVNQPMLLSVDTVLMAIEGSQDLYTANGFASLSVTQLVRPTTPPKSTGLSLVQIVGVTIAAVGGAAFILLVILVIHNCYRKLKRNRKSMGVPDGGDYIAVNESTTSWRQDKLTVNIDRPNEGINLQPMHGANVYVQRQ